MQLETHLNGISEGKIGCQLEVTQTHASDRTCSVALLQPALYAHSVVGVTSCHHHRVIHELHGDWTVETARCNWPFLTTISPSAGI